MKVIVLSAKSPIHRPSLRRDFLLILLVLVCFGLAPMAQAVGPDTDGNIPGSNNGEGIGVLVSRTTGVWNTGTGFEALNHLTAGNQNTATGLRALNSDINGGYNTATGVYSLFSNTGGFFNSATGGYSLANNIIGSDNTANGYGALYRNSADNNTATGFAALHGNTSGTLNTAVGTEALFHNDGGSDNNAFGAFALFNSNADFNNAYGRIALTSNTTGIENNAFGDRALRDNVTGAHNTAMGDDALLVSTGDGNTAMGKQAGNTITTGAENLCIGDGAGGGIVTANHSIAIGVPAAGPFADLSTTCFIGSIFGQPVSDPGTQVAVFVDQFNVVGIFNSSRRFKHDIQPMDKASEVILALKPVTFKFNSDWKGTTQYGLIAEEVAEVDPQLVVRKDGEMVTVRYEQINAMLLNEFLKEHCKNERQESKIEQQEATIVRQQKQNDVLTEALQKVSAQLELSKPTPQTARNNH